MITKDGKTRAKAIRNQMQSFVLKLDDSFDEPQHLVDTIGETFDKAKGAGTVVLAVAIHRNDPTEPKTHVRAFVKLSKRLDITVIATLVGCDVNEIYSAERGRDSVDTEMAELVNGKDPVAHQYLPNEVATYNFDYVDYYNEHHVSWNQKEFKSESNKTITQLLSNIKSGMTTKQNITDDVTNLQAYAENFERVSGYLTVYGKYYSGSKHRAKRLKRK